MTVTSRPHDDQTLSDPRESLVDESPRASASPDRCPTCGAEMAPDQRYCVECGTRRGQARFALRPGAAPVAAPSPEPTPRQPTRALSSGVALLSTIAVLLLAVLIGVLIGRSGSSNTASHQPINVVVNGGGGSSSGSGASTPTASGGGTAGKVAKIPDTPPAKMSKAEKAATAKSDNKLKKLHLKVGAPSVNTQKAENNAVKKVLGNSAKHLAAPTTKLGGKCQTGTAGCQNGKYTGNPFGTNTTS